MSKVVLLSINSKYVHSSLSVWLLAGGVSRYARLPHDVQVVEATIHLDSCDIAQSVAALGPDVVGISAYIWNAGKLPQLLQSLRDRLPDAVFVLGGPEAAYNAEYWLENGADFVVRGEGEYNFAMLLDALTESKPAPAQTESPPPGEPIDPYGDAYFNALNNRIAYLETSRGCPFQCTFCLSGGSGVRFFPMQSVKRQIYRLSQSGAKTIKLVDRTFNCNAARAYELLVYIIGLETTCCFHFEVAADLFDDRTLELLASAPPGRIQIEAGLQSFFAPALEATVRQTDLNKAQRNIETILRGRNIHVHVGLIAGLPYETLEDFKDSFNRAYAFGAHTVQLGFLKLLHGSRLREQAPSFKLQYCAAPPYEIESTPWLGAQDVQTLKQTENALQHTYNKGRFLSALEYILAVSGIDPFELFYKLGQTVPHHGTPLPEYADKLYGFFAGLPGVDSDELADRMVCDWLSMVKGKNMPASLKRDGRNQVAKIAQSLLGREITRNEAALLRAGKGVFVDVTDRDPVTMLYRLHFVDIL